MRFIWTMILILAYGYSECQILEKQLSGTQFPEKKEIRFVTYDFTPQKSPVMNPSPPDPSRSIENINYKYHWEKIGLTNYGLQTNSSIARRVQLYPDGKISAVWTTSPDGNPWQTRGSGYNHYNGTEWMGVIESRIEKSRTGWPNINYYKDGNPQIEYVVSHYAEASGGSGGYALNYNTGIGLTDWTEMEIDKGAGPIWPRTAVSGDYLFIVGNYYDTTVVKAGVKRPLVFSRYNMKTQSFDIDKITLPGYDNSLFAYGNGDNYSIDARDSVVVVVVGRTGGRVVLWRSEDMGNSWEHIIIEDFVWPEPKFSGDTIVFYYNDGSVNVVLDHNKVAHVFYGTQHGWDVEPGDNLYYPLRTWSRIAYFNDQFEWDSTMVYDTIWKDTIVYRLWANGKVVPQIMFMFDTSWNYTFNTADSTISKTPKDPITLTLYDDKDHPFSGKTLTVWPAYYTYTFDTATGNPVDSSLVPPDSVIFLDSFIVEVVDDIIGHYKKFKSYPNKGFINTTMIVDEDEDQQIVINPQTWDKDENNQDIVGGGRYGNTGLVTMPIACVDNDNNIFLIYSAPVENAINPINLENFRDVYCVFSTDGGKTWSETQNLTKNPEMEDVFATVAREVDDYVHIVFQEDEEPGTEVQNNDYPTINTIYYVAIPKSDILNQLIGPKTRPASISENNFDLRFSIYPNPATDKIKLNVQSLISEPITLSVLDVMGRELLRRTTHLQTGLNHMVLDVSDLHDGLYVIQLNSKNYRATQKFIKN